MRRPGPDDIEDTEADHLDTGHTVLAVQGEGHESARGERNEEGSPGPATRPRSPGPATHRPSTPYPGSTGARPRRKSAPTSKQSYGIDSGRKVGHDINKGYSQDHISNTSFS